MTKVGSRQREFTLSSASRGQYCRAALLGPLDALARVGSADPSMWPRSPNKTQPLGLTAMLAPVLNYVPAIAVRVNPLNSHRLGAWDTRD